MLDPNRVTHLVKQFFRAVLHFLCSIFIACRDQRVYNYFSMYDAD